MSTGMQSRTLSIYLDRASTEVYAFLSNPENFPAWASGLCSSIRNVDGQWLAQTPTGECRVDFTAPNPFGVLDHHVHLPTGQTVYVPMRLLPNGTGCEVTLTLFRQPGMSPEQFDADAVWVRKDLAALKLVVEAREFRSDMRG